MIITYQGVEGFKVQYGEKILAFNPVSKDSKQKSTRFGADIGLISLNHPDTNGKEQLSFGDREAFVIDGPGEYEVKDIFIKGLPSKSKYGGKESINTIFVLTMEGMKLCFLGALGEANLDQKTMESIDGIDILFVPIGGDGVLGPSEAYKLAVKLEPGIMIPMHFGDVGEKDSLKKFLKEGGSEDVKPIDKLTIKKKDITGMEGEIIVLSSIV